jgi:hypothetical protein
MQTMYLLIAAAAIFVQQAQPAKPASSMEDCPLHAQHVAQKAVKGKDQRFQEMNARGNVSMGFDQEKTTHHFRAADDGGVIEVRVNDPNDAQNLNAIRKHLRQIAADFTRGDFRSPLVTHGELPTGASDMQRLKSKITYRYEELPTGARVRIATKNAEALKAVQQFLGYQVTEHRTGDAPEHKH